MLAAYSSAAQAPLVLQRLAALERLQLLSVLVMPAEPTKQCINSKELALYRDEYATRDEAAAFCASQNSQLAFFDTVPELDLARSMVQNVSQAAGRAGTMLNARLDIWLAAALC